MDCIICGFGLDCGVSDFRVLSCGDWFCGLVVFGCVIWCFRVVFWWFGIWFCLVVICGFMSVR